ncbi:MAG TPA: type II CAAX endopeptidase family protein [Candidatus Limnocylindria bacterium]|jgi:membrane protease YdiL (CAAX protease family)
MKRLTLPVIAFAVLLVIWGNGVASLLGPSAWLPGGSWSFVVAGLLLIAVSLVAARAMGLDAASIGLAGDPLRGALLGLGAGLSFGLLGVVAFRVLGPAVVGRAIEYAPLATITGPELARHSVFFLPLGDIFSEEIAFRGVLLGALAGGLVSRWAILASGVVFALWHIGVVFVTIGDTTLGRPSPWFLPAVCGALIIVLVGGAAFAWLRLRTHTLATPIAAHWAFNVSLLVGLWSVQQPSLLECC